MSEWNIVLDGEPDLSRIIWTTFMRVKVPSEINGQKFLY